jgi:hypothetical protein
MTAAHVAVLDQLERCRDRLAAGRLTTDDLQAAIDAVRAPAPRQHLLFIQCQNSHPASLALGLSLIGPDGTVTIPADPERWPYRSALAAVADGWRIIAFPDRALLADPGRPHGLGCEFILERWS